MELFIGKKFKFIIESSKFDAEIIDIQNIYVIVLINGNKIKLDKKTLVNKFAEAKQEKEQIEKKHCKDCMEYKNGNCFGEKEICEDFRNSPKISEEERSRWPKDGQVSRMKSNKYFIREYDWMYDNNNHYY